MVKYDLKEMLEAAVHFGHKTQKWNPKVRRYLYGARNGIHIFDLQKTQECLEKAVEYLKHEAASGKTILFISTKPQAMQLILDTANATKMPYVINKWMGGLLTNWATMKVRIRYLRSLKEQEKSGGFDKYTKKEASDLRKTIAKLENALGGVSGLERMPDVVFVADALRDRIAIKEATKMKVPVVAIVDSNADPDGIAYPIPGNDDAIKSLTYLINAVKDAILEGRK
jgi:small subunit ribosomal protein S2